ncbi:hypothetical protein ACFLVR_00680 [Chloroflexota bacterium]
MTTEDNGKLKYGILLLVSLIIIGGYMAWTFSFSSGSGPYDAAQMFLPLVVGIVLIIDVVVGLIWSGKKKKGTEPITTEGKHGIVVPKYVSWAIILSIVIAIVAVVLYFRYVPITP